MSGRRLADEADEVVEAGERDSHGLAIAGVAASVMFAAWSINPVLIAAILFPIFFGFGWLMYVYLL